MLITIGILLLLQNLDIVRFHNSWPVILLVVGAILFARNNASMGGHIPPYANYVMTPPPPPTAAPPAPTGSKDNTTSTWNQGR